MADYTSIKNIIQSVVKTNGEQEITGANLQMVLLGMINAVDSNNEDDYTLIRQSINTLAQYVDGADNTIRSSIANLLNYVNAQDNDIRSEINSLANSLNSAKFGYNVSVFGLVAGVHTLATAVKNVPSEYRFGGQKITFKTDAGWVTYQNTSLTIGDYEDVDNWVLDSGTTVEGDVTITNNPDYEDLTQNEGGQLKFADKEYNSASYSGLGRVYLRKNIVNGVNTLTQAMMSDANTIYIIQYDYTLGDNITVPDNCVLEFEGGSIKNARGNSFKVTGTKTHINTDVAYNIFDNTLGGGFELPYIDVRWVGGVSDWNGTSGTDNHDAFKFAVDTIGKYYDGMYIYIVGQYYIGTSVSTIYNVNIWGEHNNSRHLLSGTEMSAVSSPSLIVIGKNIGIYMPGRAPVGSTAAYAYFSLKNIKVQGVSASDSIFLYYTASGSPSRGCVVEECEFTGLSRAFQIVSVADTVIGNLTISKCDVYENSQFIKATPNEGTAYRTLCNCVIKDSTIEQNGKNCIYLERTFGPIIIDNNILEGQAAPIFLRPNISEVTISNNYFEVNPEDAITVIPYDHHSKLFFYSNHYETPISIHVANLSLFGKLNGLSDDSRIGNCYVEDIDNYTLKWLGGGNYGSHVVFDRFKTGVNYSYPLNQAFQIRKGNIIGRECPTEMQSVGLIKEVTDASKDLIVAFFVSGNGILGFYKSGNGYGSGYSTYGLKDGGLVFYKALPYSTGQNEFYTSNYGSGNILTVLGFVDEDTPPSYVSVPDTNTVLSGTKRPSFPDMPVGYAFFDKKISPNRMIYYTGSNNWVDATGTPV